MASLNGGVIYVGGYYGDPDITLNFTLDVQTLSSVTGTWKMVAPLPTVRGSQYSATQLNDGRCGPTPPLRTIP
jgi:hypothetical protein